MKICEKCGEEIKSRRLKICNRCYCRAWYAENKPPPKPIKERSPNCLDCGKLRERGGRSVKYCNYCALKRAYIKKPEAHQKRMLQSRNYRRLKSGIPLDLPPLRAKKGSGHLDRKGYVQLCKLGHPNAKDDRGKIYEHTFIMSEHLGRPLAKHENVHHINGIRSDNRIENLELWSRSQPPGQRVEDKLVWCKEFLEGYGYEVKKSNDE